MAALVLSAAGAGEGAVLLVPAGALITWTASRSGAERRIERRTAPLVETSRFQRGLLLAVGIGWMLIGLEAGLGLVR